MDRPRFRRSSSYASGADSVPRTRYANEEGAEGAENHDGRSACLNDLDHRRDHVFIAHRAYRGPAVGAGGALVTPASAGGV